MDSCLTQRSRILPVARRPTLGYSALARRGAIQLVSTLPSIETVVARLTQLGIALPPGRVRVDAFGDSPELSEALLALIRSGQKRAGTGLLWAMAADGETPPEVGDIEIEVDLSLIHI